MAAGILVFRPQRIENQTIESMFAMDGQLHASYHRLKRTFGGNEVVLAVYPDNQLMSDAGKQRQRELGERLSRVSGIALPIISITALLDMIDEFGLERFSAVLNAGGFDLSPEILRENTIELFEGFTHSKDHRTAALILILKAKEDNRISRGSIIRAIRQEFANYSSDSGWDTEVLLVGEPVMVADGFRMVKRDGQRLGWVATLALSGVVLLIFRSIRWTIIPALVVQFSLLASEALVALLRIQVTIVGSMSTSIITVIAVTTTIHLIVRIQKNLSDGAPYRIACESAIRQLALPITFACLTDAIGFGALWFAELEPVQDFATVMCAGSLLVLVAYWFLVPTLALAMPSWTGPFWNPVPLTKSRKSLSGAGLMAVLRFARQRQRLMLCIAGFLVGYSVFGLLQNRIESDFTRNFRSDSSVVRSYSFVEEKLGGAGVWDIILPAPPQLNVKFLARVKRLQQRLRTEVTTGGEQEPGLTKVLSLVDSIEAFSNRSIEGLSDMHLNLGLTFFSSRMPEFQRSLVNRDPQAPQKNFYRIMLRSRERKTSEEKKRIIAQVESICREEFSEPSPDNSEVRVTGFYVLLTYMIDSVIRDQWLTFGIAAAGILLMLMISLRNIRYALVGMLPNALPILVVLGTFGWLRIPINLGIALIAAVAIGISIDSSIHYIYDFQIRLRNHPLTEAIERSQRQIGRALIYSTLALVIGFCSLCVSEFLPTVYFGGTAMAAMIGGLLGNLFLLPLLITVCTTDDSAD